MGVDCCGTGMQHTFDPRSSLSLLLRVGIAADLSRENDDTRCYACGVYLALTHCDTFSIGRRQVQMQRLPEIQNHRLLLNTYSVTRRYRTVERPAAAVQHRHQCTMIGERHVRVEYKRVKPKARLDDEIDSPSMSVSLEKATRPSCFGFCQNETIS